MFGWLKNYIYRKRYRKALDAFKEEMFYWGLDINDRDEKDFDEAIIKMRSLALTAGRTLEEIDRNIKLRIQ